MPYRNRLRCILLAICTACVLSSAVHASGPPPQVVVVAPRGASATELDAQIAKWRADSLIGRALRLHAVEQDEPGFSALAILDMKSEEALARWSIAQQLPKGWRIRRVDSVVRSGDLDVRAAAALFEVNVYSVKTSSERYREFCQEYIEPLMAGQIDAGLMAAFTMFVEREELGERHAVLVKAYRDAPTYHEKVGDAKLAVRAQLEKQHPTYSKWHSIKGTFRSNVSETLATMSR